MKVLYLAGLISLLSLGCATTSGVLVGEDLYPGSHDCLDDPYNCLDYPYSYLYSPYPWYGLYPYDWWDDDDDHHDYWYYPPYDRYYPYYLWKHRHPKPKRPWFVRRNLNQAGERRASIRKARREARERRIRSIRQARQHRAEVRRDRANGFRSSFHRSRPGHGFRGGFGGFRRR